MIKHGILPSALALSCFCVVGVNADQVGDSVEKSPSLIHSNQTAGRVFLNPKTGELGGIPPGVEPHGLSPAMQEKLSRSDRGLQVRFLSTGAKVVDLQGRFQNMSVGTLDNAGNVHIGCSHSKDVVERSITTGEYFAYEHEESE